MMFKKLLPACLLLSASFSLASVASARPYECFGGPAGQNYDMAFQERTNELYNVWNYTYRADCGNQVDFETAYGNPFAEVGPAIRKCKNAGINAATTQVLNGIAATCRETGIVYGAQDGRNFGTEYCSTARGYSAPVGDFQFSYEETCRDVFIRYVNTFCSYKRNNDPNFLSTVTAKCKL